MDPAVFIDNVKVKLVNHIISVRKKYYGKDYLEVKKFDRY